MQENKSGFFSEHGVYLANDTR